MSDIIKVPDGIEIDLIMYLTSDSTGANVRYALRGMRALTPFLDKPDASVLATQAGLISMATDWRMMTINEIEEYKLDEDEEDT
jgi:hypothetical protein